MSHGTVGWRCKSYSELPNTHFPLSFAVELPEGLGFGDTSKFAEDKDWHMGGLFLLLKSDWQGEKVSYPISSLCFCPVHGFDVQVEIAILQPQDGKDKGQKATN